MSTVALPRACRRRLPRRYRRALRGSLRGPGMSSGQKTFLAGTGLVVVLVGGHKVAVPAAPAAPAAKVSSAASPFRPVPGAGVCSMDDPTTSGCLTPVAAHGLGEITRVFGPQKAACWDKHLQNPTSDHPKGRACDLTFGSIGHFPTGADLDRGWAVAKWLRASADELHVRYVIWQGRIWQADDDRDLRGWGKPYNGGGVYDPHDATGGHYDHVHVSFQAT